MQKRKIAYQLLTLLAASGVIISYLFGPGAVAPEATMYTGLCVLLMYCAQYLALREGARLKGQKPSTTWVVITLVVLAVIVALEAIILTIAAFLWFIALSILAVIAVILLFRLIRSKNKKTS